MTTGLKPIATKNVKTPARAHADSSECATCDCVILIAFGALVIML